jgi:hypothetical protein
MLSVANIEKQNGKPIVPPPFDQIIESNASLEGWEAKYNDKSSGGIGRQPKQTPY